MANQKSNAILSGSKCTRCGKPRIIVDTYEERVETSVVTYTVTACSDPECQKIVNQGLKEEEARRVVIKKEQERREIQRKEAIAERRKASSI